jgi:hypothetical protein
MNKNVLLVTVAATALIAGASLASAQTMNTEQPKASAPMKPDSEKAGQSAQSPKKDADKAQTTGQGPKAEDAKKAQDSKPQTTGQAPKAEDAKKPEETKKAPDSKPQTSGQAPKADDANKKPEDAKKPEDTKQQGQAGQAGGGAQAQISTEQRTQIRQTVMRVGDAPRVSSVNFSLSVGTVVPRTVKYVLLPPRVVEIYPAWRGYHFFIVGDQIVIVEPGSLRIVAVIPA